MANVARHQADADVSSIVCFAQLHRRSAGGGLERFEKNSDGTRHADSEEGERGRVMKLPRTSERPEAGALAQHCIAREARGPRLHNLWVTCEWLVVQMSRTDFLLA